MTEFHPYAVLNAAVFAGLGIMILCVAFVVVDWLTPYKLWEEIVEHKNLALAVMVGCMSIAVGIIIAAAVH